MLVTLLALAGPVLAAGGGIGAQTTQDVVRDGDHFQLVCHFQSEDAADQALVAAEAAWSRTLELLDIDEVEPVEDVGLLRVHLYRDTAAYEVVEGVLTHGAFRSNLAFSHHATMSSHIALQPALGDEALARVGLPTQTLRLLAHESAHLVMYVHLSNFRSHPEWFAEGLATWVEEQVCRDLALAFDAEADPYFSNSLLTVKRMNEADELPTVEQIMRGQLSELESDQRYDVHWAFFRFLRTRKHAKQLKQIVATTRKLGGGKNFDRRLYNELEQALGKHGIASLDRGFVKYVASFDPEWDEVFRSLYRTGDHWTQAAFGRNAIAWRLKPSGKQYTVAGELTILPGPGKQLNVFLGRSDAGFFSVAFSAGGGVTLFEYLSATSAWQRRGDAKCADVRLDEPFQFSITVDGAAVRVQVNRVDVVAGKAETLDLRGPWGLSAQARSVGIWKLSKAPGL